MKTVKKITAAISLALMLILSLTSCAKADEAELTSLRMLTETAAEAFASSDIPSLYPLFDERYIPEERAKEVLPKISEYLGDFSSFEVKEMTGYSYKKSNSAGNVTATFLVGTDKGEFYTVIGKMTDSDKICFLDVSLKEDMTPTYTGTLTTLRGANPLQWAVAVLGVAVMVFSFWMVIDCAGSKIKRKALWIIAVLFGFLSITFSLSPGECVRLFFGVGNIVTASALKVYSTAELQLALVLPIGALVYFIKRKELKARAAIIRRPVQDIESSSDVKSEESTDNTNIQ